MGPTTRLLRASQRWLILSQNRTMAGGRAVLLLAALALCSPAFSDMDAEAIIPELELEQGDNMGDDVLKEAKANEELVNSVQEDSQKLQRPKEDGKVITWSDISNNFQAAPAPEKAPLLAKGNSMELLRAPKKAPPVDIKPVCDKDGECTCTIDVQRCFAMPSTPTTSECNKALSKCSSLVGKSLDACEKNARKACLKTVAHKNLETTYGALCTAEIEKKEKLKKESKHKEKVHKQKEAENEKLAKGAMEGQAKC